MNYKKFLVNTGNNMSVTDLDFSKEEDFNMLMGWMHGEDVCKEKFPLFYERFVKAAAVPGRMKEEQGFKDGISLSLPLYDTKRDVYVVQGKTCLTDEPQFILQRIEVRGAGDELIAQTSDADMFQDYT